MMLWEPTPAVSIMTPPTKQPPGMTEQARAGRGPVSAEGEAEIISRVLAGDRAAFTELVRRYHGPLLRLALAFVRDRPLAEEIVQDTWLGVLDGLSGFEGRSSLKTWIFRILTNRAKSRSVREARSVPFSALSNEPDDGESEGGVDPARFDTKGMWQDPPQAWAPQTPEELVHRQEAAKVMEDIVEQLSESQRAVLTLRDLEGVDPEETCNLLGITMTNQRVLLHRARTKVREALERHFRGAESC
jgi:RNA polymerase sigma-70 factor, ECF subfamily